MGTNEEFGHNWPTERVSGFPAAVVVLSPLVGNHPSARPLQTRPGPFPRTPGAWIHSGPMGTDTPKPPKAKLLPVPWHLIEPHFRAGIRNMSAISAEFGVSRAAILKHADKHGWVRKLGPAIRDAADHIVTRTGAQVTPATIDVVTGQVTAQPVLSDKALVDAGAQQLALVRLDHRKDIAALRTIIKGLMRELAPMVDQPELYAMVYDALANPEEPAIQALRDMAATVNSLPTRIKAAKDLADTLYRAIAMEREAFGLTAEGGGGERYTVIVRDFTGKGDPDSPNAGQPEPDEY